MVAFTKLGEGLYVNSEHGIRISDTPRTLPRPKGENWGVHWKTSTVGSATRIKHVEYFRTLNEALKFARSLAGDKD